MESQINWTFANDKGLRKAKSRLDAYMEGVQDKTDELYRAYTNEQDPDEKKRLKREYTDKVKSLTVDSKEYKKIVEAFAAALTAVNQKATDIVNDTTSEIYAINYNQMADDLKKVGLLNDV